MARFLIGSTNFQPYNFELKRHRLQGTFPAMIGKVTTTLAEFALSSNNFSGKIPDLSGLTSLELLDLRDNNLDSELPAMLEGLVTALYSARTH